MAGRAIWLVDRPPLARAVPLARSVDRRRGSPPRLRRSPRLAARPSGRLRVRRRRPRRCCPGSPDPRAGCRRPARLVRGASCGDGTAAEMARPGVNVLGHFCFPSGLRVSVEAMSDADGGGGPRGVPPRHPHPTSSTSRTTSTSPGARVHDVTVIHAQPEPVLRRRLRARRHGRAPAPHASRRLLVLGARYGAGVVERVRASGRRAVDRDALRRRRAPGRHRQARAHALPRRAPRPFTPRSRAHFGLPAREDGRFAFLFSFHMGQRDGAQEPARADRELPPRLRRGRAGGPRAEDDLVRQLTTPSWPSCARRQGWPTSTSSTACSTSDDITALMDSCDAYVSLHRSEGLGLTMAEAMLLGKPVVATRYSGNLDFMDDDEQPPGRLRGRADPRHRPPLHGAGARWAEPSTAHAAELMRRVYDDPPFREALGRRAKRRPSATCRSRRRAAASPSGWMPSAAHAPGADMAEVFRTLARRGEAPARHLRNRAPSRRRLRRS